MQYQVEVNYTLESDNVCQGKLTLRLPAANSGYSLIPELCGGEFLVSEILKSAWGRRTDDGKWKQLTITFTDKSWADVVNRIDAEKAKIAPVLMRAMQKHAALLHGQPQNTAETFEIVPPVVNALEVRKVE